MQNSLTTYVESLGYTITDFYAEVRDVQVDSSTDEHMKLFIDCLIASMDYESFYKVMIREAKKISCAPAEPKSLSSPARRAAEGGEKGSASKAVRPEVDAKLGSEDSDGVGVDVDMDAKEAKEYRK